MGQGGALPKGFFDAEMKSEDKYDKQIDPVAIPAKADYAEGDAEKDDKVERASANNDGGDKDLSEFWDRLDEEEQGEYRQKVSELKTQVQERLNLGKDRKMDFDQLDDAAAGSDDDDVNLEDLLDWKSK